MNRVLCDVEKVLWLLGQAVPHNFTVFARISGKLPEFVITKALELLQAKHPPLRCRIVDGVPLRYTSENVPPVPLKVLERKSESQWIEEMEKEFQKALPLTTGPLIRVTQLDAGKGCDLLVTFSHIIADATSGVSVVEELLCMAEKILKGELYQPGSSMPELPFSTDMFKEEVVDAARKGAQKTTADPIDLEPAVLDGNDEASLLNRLNKVIHKELSPVETKSLVKKSRQNNTTVHALLCASVLRTVAMKIRGSRNIPSTTPLNIGCCSPVDIRHLFTQPVVKGIGDFITDSLHFQLVDESVSIWDTARAAKASLQEYLDSGEGIRALLNVGEFLKTHKTPLDILTTFNKVYPPVVATNLGRLNIPDRFGDLSLEAIHFALTIAPISANGFAISVTTFQGRMAINFIYTEPFLSAEIANQMADDTMKRIRQALTFSD